VNIPRTDLDVFPLCLGGNVFGWTADQEQSFAVLDAYAAAGGNFIDTANSYSSWVEGHVGGESETVIGRWMASRRNRERMIVATKAGRLTGRMGLSAANLRLSADESLRRLGVERIDLYYAHADDPETPLEETLGAFDELVRAGKVRAIAASNYSAPRLAEALAISDNNGLARYVALQPHYNLVERSGYEADLAPLCAREQLACFPYFALAKGFLTGKYRPGVTVDSPRSTGAGAYLNEGGLQVLAALDEIARAHGTTVAAVSLAWLAAQPTVVAPIASARTPQQLAELLPMATLKLSGVELDRLSAASEAKAPR
jgi:aryl-alcohol dehydrogenase-like predicted oxidoreductase